MENKCQGGILSRRRAEEERGREEAGAGWRRGSESRELPEVAAGRSGVVEKEESRKPARLWARVGCWSSRRQRGSVLRTVGRGRRSSLLQTVKGARKNHHRQAERQERLRGRWTKIPDRVVFSFSDKLPISSLSEVFE